MYINYYMYITFFLFEVSGRQATVRPRAQFIILSLADRTWVIAACNLHLYKYKYLLSFHRFWTLSIERFFFSK